MEFGVVRERVVLWDVLERTWCSKIDAQVEHERGGPARVVSEDGEVRLWNGGGRRAPEGAVGRTQSKASWKGWMNRPRGGISKVEDRFAS